MSLRRGIYVEILIRGEMSELWRLTQDPALHQRWDLRFTDITYLARDTESEPQRFLYSTRIGFGMRIDGEGESTGERDLPSGERLSALKFWSDDPKSLIRTGSGYWKYIPADGGVRFLTWYDYQPRFGRLGSLVDAICFRPLIGWATAWSFSSLRLWIERGIHPEQSRRLAAIHAVARLGTAFIWLWHGLVPKILFHNRDELALLGDAGIPASMLPWIGAAEISIALGAILSWRWRPYWVLNGIAMVLVLLQGAMQSPQYLTAAFNPVTLNTSMLMLSIIGYLSASDLASAKHCSRRPSREQQ